MEDLSFIELVALMRRHQREFWRMKPENRPPAMLGQCKKLEKRVDDAVEELRRGQGQLFA